MQDVYISSFNEPEFLRGTYAEFYVEPQLDFNQHRMAQPGTPSGRFASTQTGSNLALDTTSLQAVAIYAHLEKLQQLNKFSGADAFVPKRISVGIDVGIITDNKIVDNNAQYNPSLDSLLFVPYTNTDLPISFNAGVIGHEYFHSIFQHIVGNAVSSQLGFANIDEPTNQSSPIESGDPQAGSQISIKEYNRFVLRGINEGLADFWGWIYSGDETFVGRSLSHALESRRLNRKSVQFYGVDFFKAALSADQNDQVRTARAYILGSQYAVYFHNLTLKIFEGKSDEKIRIKMAKALILALPKFKSEIVGKVDGEYIAPEIFIKSFLTSIKENLAPKDFDVCASFYEVAPLANSSSMTDLCPPGVTNAK